MNQITKKQYNEIKNNTSYSVVSFRDGIRTHTYCGLDIIKTIEEIMLRQSYGQECLIIKNLPVEEVSRDRKDYNKYIIFNKKV